MTSSMFTVRFEGTLNWSAIERQSLLIWFRSEIASEIVVFEKIDFFFFFFCSIYYFNCYYFLNKSRGFDLLQLLWINLIWALKVGLRKYFDEFSLCRLSVKYGPVDLVVSARASYKSQCDGLHGSISHRCAVNSGLCALRRFWERA